jgi:hypothetical protein
LHFVSRDVGATARLIETPDFTGFLAGEQQDSCLQTVCRRRVKRLQAKITSETPTIGQSNQR